MQEIKVNNQNPLFNFTIKLTWKKILLTVKQRFRGKNWNGIQQLNVDEVGGGNGKEDFLVGDLNREQLLEMEKILTVYGNKE